METLSRKQFDRAYVLARGFGHHWAGIDLPVYEAAFDGDRISVESIEAVSRQVPCGPCGGIGAPTVADGVVSHRTSTGRLQWIVEADGEVTLAISRPTPETACWEDTYDSYTVATATVVGDRACAKGYEGCCARHIDALAEALCQLVDREVWLPAVTALRERWAPVEGEE